MRVPVIVVFGSSASGCCQPGRQALHIATREYLLLGDDRAAPLMEVADALPLTSLRRYRTKTRSSPRAAEETEDDDHGVAATYSGRRSGAGRTSPKRAPRLQGFHRGPAKNGRSSARVAASAERFYERDCPRHHGAVHLRTFQMFCVPKPDFDGKEQYCCYAKENGYLERNTNTARCSGT